MACELLGGWRRVIWQADLAQGSCGCPAMKYREGGESEGHEAGCSAIAHLDRPVENREPHGC